MADTAVGDIVSVEVNPDGPYGVKFKPDHCGNAAVIQSWEKLENGSIGDLQKHGGLHIDDVLFSVNDNELFDIPHEDCLALINGRNVVEKDLQIFELFGIWTENKGLASVTKSRFYSIVERSRVVDPALSSKCFAEYEVVCQLYTGGARCTKEVAVRWSVWRRYTEFQQLHHSLQQTLGWRIKGICFPSGHTFRLGKLSPAFLDMRRHELNHYWLRMLGLDKIADFDKHHSSGELREFLAVDEYCSCVLEKERERAKLEVHASPVAVLSRTADPDQAMKSDDS